MIDVAEHVYHDDPKSGHPDCRTELRDVRYYFLGNGWISAAIQHAPAGEGSPYGVLLMDPEQLRMKRESLTFDAKSGIADTMATICEGKDGLPCKPAHPRIGWEPESGIPCVGVEWQTPSLRVKEEFFCPDVDTPRLTRRIRLVNSASKEVHGSVSTGTGARSWSRDFHLGVGREQSFSMNYQLVPDGYRLEPNFLDSRPEFAAGGEYWNSASRVQLDSPALHHLFQTAAWQLPAVISRHGRIDAGIWQYRREWVRDQSFMAHGALLAGHPDIAGVMIDRLLREFVSDAGSTVDSSALRDPADAELDQNGILLHVLHEYVLWTGDLDLVLARWGRIAVAAEFPLLPMFREPASGLMANQREYWERHAAFGIEPGIELAYQVFVSLGLSAASQLAQRIGRIQEAARWQSEAVRIRTAVLHHPVFAMVDARGFRKRRGLDGSIQECILPRSLDGLPPAVGLARDVRHPLDPDSSCALPVVYGLVPPDSQIARDTLRSMEALWNQGWDSGGYGRYHMDSDPDSPGPWPFPSIAIARACLECREYEKVQRVIGWLSSLPQYPSGAFFEMYGNRIAPPYAQNGIVPWNWAEIIMLVVKNVLGIQPEPEALRIHPRLLPEMEHVEGDLPFRGCRLQFSFTRESGIATPQFRGGPGPVQSDGDGVRILFTGRDLTIEGRIPRS
jgi:hypothetical protein